MPEIHRFGNGIVLRKRELLDVQLERYRAPGNPNLHEPVEEDWLTRVLNAQTGPEPVFLDVGAAVGYYSIFVKVTWPAARVIAVEPLPAHVDALHANAALNGLKQSDIDVLPVAVTDRDGPVFLRQQAFGSGLVDAASPTTLEVEGQRLVTLLEGLPPVDVMKMDIQGLELAILGAARPVLEAKAVGAIIVGTHGKRLFAETRDLLTDCGYHILFSDPEPAFQPDGLVVATAHPPAAT